MKFRMAPHMLLIGWLAILACVWTTGDQVFDLVFEEPDVVADIQATSDQPDNPAEHVLIPSPRADSSATDAVIIVLDLETVSVVGPLTGHAALDMALCAINAGHVYHFLTKPWSKDELVTAVIRGLEMATGGRHIVWKIGPLPRVIGDPSLLKQVFTNLIDNALKYSRLRDPATIEVGCAGEEAGRAVLFVRDDGVGFDMQYAGKLFGVFQRLHRVDEFEGTGIGLATVRRIVGRHGGRVWAEGILDHGATVFFTLEAAV